MATKPQTAAEWLRRYRNAQILSGQTKAEVSRSEFDAMVTEFAEDAGDSLLAHHWVGLGYVVEQAVAA